jgi:hypothetical protein
MQLTANPAQERAEGASWWAAATTNRSVWVRSLSIAALALAVFALSIWDSSSELRKSPFHPDESRWINRAYYLREIRHPLSSIWADRYLIRAQPPMGSYIIGLGLLTQGRDLTTNGPWDFQYGFEKNVNWNVVKGNMPDEADLLAARRLNMVFGALTCVSIFFIVGLLTNWFGGFIAGSFMAIHPLHLYISTLAVSDAMFTTFASASVLAAIWLARKPNWWRAVLLAVALALGASTKLSPLFLAVGLAGFSIVLLADHWLRNRRSFGRLWRWISRRESGQEQRLGWMLLVQPFIVFGLFVLVYPYLWSDPFGRTKTILDFRQYEMDNQARFWPKAAIHNRFDALERTWQNLQDRYSSSDRLIGEIGDHFGRSWSGYGFDLFLALPGLAILCYLAWKHGLASPHAFGLVVLGGQSALIVGALGVDFNRYYLPLVLTVAVGVGVLCGWVSGLAWSWFRSWNATRAEAGTSQPASMLQPVSASTRGSE